MAIYISSKKSFLILVLFFFVVIKSYGQNITNYAFSTPTDNYAALSGATTPSRTSGNTDEGYYNNLPIGFDFWYMGQKVTTFSVSTNGWMTLGQAITNAAYVNNLTSGGNRPVIAPLWDNLSIRSSGEISYLTSGAEGSRILTVQWRDMQWNSGATSRISFQAKLYEETGQVRFSYLRVNNTAPSGSPGASIGISGTSSGQFASVTSIATPAVSYTTETTNIVTKPANNTNYNFLSTVAAPTSLSFTAIGPKQLTLNWADISGDNIGYAVYRSTNATTGFVQIGSTLGPSAVNYTDTGLAENTTYYYKIFAVRESKSTALSGSASTTPCPQVYPAGVQVNYRYNGNARDELGLNHGQFQGGIPTGTTDRFGNANHAYTFNGTSNYMSTTSSYSSPARFTISGWIKTTTTEGGKIISFGDSRTGTSASHDRHLYMVPNGRIYLGVYPGAVRVISSPSSYNDGNWHQVTGVLSASGMLLYIDGALIASNASVTTAQTYTGYWRVGYDRMDSSWTDWPGGARTDAYFGGEIDDVIIYDRALSAAEVLALYQPTFIAGNTLPVCAGYTFGLTAPSFVGAIYSWSGPNGYTSTLQNPSGIELNETTVGVYTVNISISGGCTTSATTRVDFGVGNPGLWAGKKDVNWSNVNNWCAGTLPTNTVNVSIPTSGPSFNPTLNTEGNANNIAVQTGRALTIESSGNLQVAGTITSASAIVASNGTVTLNGTSAQIIPANVFSGNVIKNLTTNNAAGVTLNGALRLTGVLTPSAGILETNGNLTLTSSATSTANVATMPSGASVRGNVKVERFLQGGAINKYRTYRMLSSPVYDNSASFINSNVEGNRSAKFSQLIDDIIVSNPNAATGGFDVTHNNQASAWTYASGFSTISNINTAVNAGKGMYVFFRGNRDNFTEKTNLPFANPENTVIDFDGVLNQQDITVSLPNGTSFLGNPYASTIDWDSTNWGTDKVNVGNGVWIWRPDTKSYATYSGGIGVNGGSRYIASGQSFFVRTAAAGTGSIKFKESIKASTQQSPILLMSTPTQSRINFSDGMGIGDEALNAPPSLLRISMKPLATYGEDETVVVFKPGSSAEFSEEDALHIDGEVVNIATLVGTKKLAINFHSPLEQSTTIQLHVNAAATGSYLFRFNLDEYHDYHSLVLRDHYLNQDIPVTSGLIYSFDVDKNKTASFGANRFSLSTNTPAVLPISLTHFTANKQNNGVLLSWKTMSETNVKDFQIHKAGDDGSYVKLGEVAAKGSGEYTFFDSQPYVGLNYYKLMLTDLNGSENEAGVLSVLYALNGTKALKIYPNPVGERFTIKLANLPVGQFTVELLDVAGHRLMSIDTSEKQLAQGYGIDVNHLNAGVFFVKVTSRGSGKIINIEKVIKK